MMLGRIAIVAAACGEVARSMRRIQPIDPALGIALREARALAASPVGEEVRTTVHEAAPQREARHRYVTSEAERLKPDLPAEKLASLLALSDHNEDQFRDARAKFMLGELSEDDYIAALKQVVRAGVDETKTFLSPDEFAALEGNPEYDPFDPSTTPVAGQAPYLSREEEQAMGRP